jgi:hypothetical protein
MTRSLLRSAIPARHGLGEDAVVGARTLEN